MKPTKRGGKRPNAGAKPKQEAEKVKPITIYAKNKLIAYYGSDEIKRQLTEVIRKLEANMPILNDDFIDLFEACVENPNIIPIELQNVLKKYELFEGGNYQTCANLLQECEQIGYTFKYGLDGEPYGLHKITETETN